LGVALLAGKDKADLCHGYSPQFDLSPGEHEIMVHAMHYVRSGVEIDASVTPAKITVTIPASIESAPDRLLPPPKDPLRFTVSAYNEAADKAVIRIYVANESTDLWHYPYRGDTPPWHRSNWYRLEVDGKIIEPYWNGSEHKGRPGQNKIAPMNQWCAHT